MKRVALVLLLICPFWMAGTFGNFSAAEEPVWQWHLKRGEFAAAKAAIEKLPAKDQDAALLQVAGVQRGLGDMGPASETYREIDSSTIGVPVSPLADVVGAGEASRRAAGGSSFADFTQLIDLIQTTVNPETWQDMGGESTISEYPQGVYVDAEGTLETVHQTLSNDVEAEVAGMLASRNLRATAQDWKAASKMRFVSLRRLKDAVIASEIAGRNPDQAMSHLAGLSRIEGVYLVDDDIVLAGEVSGIVSNGGWLRDRETGMAAIRADVLAETIASLQRGIAFGCTIDPTTTGLQNAAKVASQVQSKNLSIGKAAGRLADAIGMQRIEIFGTSPNTPLALMMVEADRHMKELALGVHPMPEFCQNYLEVIEANIDRGLPNDLLLRLWFTANERTIRSNRERTVFELSGTPIRLSGQNERAVADGSRGHAAADFRTDEFVEGFNRNWPQIRADYPIYAGLEAIFQAASAAATSHRYAKSNQQKSLLEWWTVLGERLNGGASAWQTPTQVKTIAVLHNIRKGNKRHHVLVASGGVLLEAGNTISRDLTVYPALDAVASPVTNQPVVIQDWWWDR